MAIKKIVDASQKFTLTQCAGGGGEGDQGRVSGSEQSRLKPQYRNAGIDVIRL